MTVTFKSVASSQKIPVTLGNISDNFATAKEVLDGLDTNVSAVAGALVSQDGLIPRPKYHPAVSSTAGQTLFTLPDPYKTGTLIVKSGGLEMAPTVHYTETDPVAGQPDYYNSITFTSGRVLNELVQVTEMQIGPEQASPTPIPTVSLYLTDEVPSGAVDSTDATNGNGVFTLAHAIDAMSVPKVFVASMELVANTEYTWSGNTITILNGHKPIVGEKIHVQYIWRIS